MGPSPGSTTRWAGISSRMGLAAQAITTGASSRPSQAASSWGCRDWPWGMVRMVSQILIAWAVPWGSMGIVKVWRVPAR